MDNVIKALMTESVEAEIFESSQTIEMLLGKGEIGAFYFGFDQHILIMFPMKNKADS